MLNDNGGQIPVNFYLFIFIEHENFYLILQYLFLNWLFLFAEVCSSEYIQFHVNHFTIQNYKINEDTLEMR